ncbi:L-dopachrome tautomerase-related protein [Paraglaciecola sp. L3A3]|uniref:L-dopachrome tautomerase-related protein n=1 Tax=Paraglaciecola sp. L3A3 TaxID=2686358 RepID=UPI00131AE50F|nr:L-dopachrome tautomerase-related protein [Paraglaciecola sp. L3A3]
MTRSFKLLASAAMIATSAFSLNMAAADEARQLEVVAKLSAETPPGNIAVGPDGRIFLSIHGFYGKSLRIVELLPDGTTKPYPNENWAYAAQSRESGGLYGVLGLNIDANGILWMLDTSGPDHAGRLVGWNTKKEQLHKVIYLAKPVITGSSFLNDLAVDSKNNAIYIADTGTSSIIVVDLTTGNARRVLKESKSTKAEDIDMVIDGQTVYLNGQPVRMGVNPITIDSNFEYVYYGAMSGTSLYRIATKDLLDTRLSEQELNKKVQRYGDKPISDGITIDNAGYVYVTSITNDAIGYVQPNGHYKTLIQRDDVSWPDGLAVGLDSYIYGTVNELHRSPVLNNGKDATKGEFKVVRFKALSDANTGR